jgi:hypothetical protein
VSNSIDLTRLVIDDLRTHQAGGLHLRSSASALEWFQQNPHQRIPELWLDHDLGGDDTIRPVVHYLEERCYNGDPAQIDCIYVHTANDVGARWIMSSRLLTEHYRMLRSYITPPTK